MKKEISSRNRRKYFRYQIRILGYVFTAGVMSSESRCCLINFSLGGIALETNLDISPGAEIQLQINLVPEKVDIFGRAVRKQQVMENLFRYGIKYTRLNIFERIKLRRKIKKWLRSQEISGE
jgi:c-di-GMP-binding flagellar brake protein YcgR